MNPHDKLIEDIAIIVEYSLNQYMDSLQKRSYNWPMPYEIAANAILEYLQHDGSDAEESLTMVQLEKLQKKYRRLYGL